MDFLFMESWSSKTQLEVFKLKIVQLFLDPELQEEFRALPAGCLEGVGSIFVWPSPLTPYQG
jgi:hypothetical protein